MKNLSDVSDRDTSKLRMVTLLMVLAKKGAKKTMFNLIQANKQAIAGYL